MKRISLTFDNGPHETGTNEILDVLAARRLRATFFLVGASLNRPGALDLAKQVAASGHVLGNHTASHGAALGRRPGQSVAEYEIGAMQEKMGALTEQRLFRPNGEKGRLGPHLLSQDAVDYLMEKRFTVVAWNCVPEDWVAPAGSWVQRAKRIMSDQEWTSLVLHDHRMAGSAHFLGRFLDDLIEAGYEFTTEFPPETVLIQDGVPTTFLAGNFTSYSVS